MIRKMHFKDLYTIVATLLVILLVIQNQKLKRIINRELSITELGLDQVYKIEKYGSPTLGDPDSPVSIVVFSDFECPHCLQGAQSLENLMQKYPQKLEIIFKHLPAASHENAFSAALCSMAAFSQGRFWEMHDLLFFSGEPLNRSNANG